MGNSSSRNSDKSPAKSSPPINIDGANKSICHIFYHSEAERLKTGILSLKSSPGVAVCFTDDNGTMHHSIVTHNLSLDSSISLQYSGAEWGNLDSGLGLTTIDLELTFTCPLLGITLVKLQDNIVKCLKEAGCFFHDLQEKMNMAINYITTLLVLDGPGKEIDMYFSQFKEYYGHDVLYTVKSNRLDVPPGLPIVTLTGQLVAIHKGLQNDKEYIGAPTATILKVLQQLYKCTSITQTISNPIDTSPYEGKLEENGLEVLPCADSQRYKDCTMYISPASPMITPIWFMPMYLGWYWTPTDPNGPEWPNWMSVDRLEVIGGGWHGDIPAPKNITIIRWLNQHNIDSILSSSSNNN